MGNFICNFDLRLTQDPLDHITCMTIKKLNGRYMYDFLRSVYERGLRTNSPNSKIVMLIFQVMILVLRLVYFGHIYTQLFPILKRVIKTSISSYNDNISCVQG